MLAKLPAPPKAPADEAGESKPGSSTDAVAPKDDATNMKAKDDLVMAEPKGSPPMEVIRLYRHEELLRGLGWLESESETLEASLDSGSINQLSMVETLTIKSDWEVIAAIVAEASALARQMVDGLSDNIQSRSRIGQKKGAGPLTNSVKDEAENKPQ